MAWEVEFTDEFGEWWNSLSPEEQESVNASVRLLQEKGPALGRPHADTLSKMSKRSQMKELRIQHAGDAYRVLFAFDPKRNAVLLLGDRKADQKWYKQYQKPTRFSMHTWPPSSASKMKSRRRDDMARNFRELQEKMSPESRARSEARAQAMLKELPLSELREAQQLTQAELAKRLNIGQDAVSKLEHRADMYLSTLSDFIRAAGGTLELTARFPSGDVHLIRLQGASSQPAKTTKSDRREKEPADALTANLRQSLASKRRATHATSRRSRATKRARAS